MRLCRFAFQHDEAVMATRVEATSTRNWLHCTATIARKLRPAPPTNVGKMALLLRQQRCRCVGVENHAGNATPILTAAFATFNWHLDTHMLLELSVLHTKRSLNRGKKAVKESRSSRSFTSNELLFPFISFHYPNIWSTDKAKRSWFLTTFLAPSSRSR